MRKKRMADAPPVSIPLRRLFVFPIFPIFTILLFLLFLPVTGRAASPEPERTGKEKIVVAATIAPLADFVRQVGGERVRTILLLPPGASPHTFEPTPGLLTALKDVRVLFSVGAGLDAWADRMGRAAGGPGMVPVALTDGLDLLAFRDEDRHDHSDDHDHGMEGRDPHVWLDPTMSIRLVEKIADVFSGIDGAHASEYRANAERYRAELTALDADLAHRIGSFRVKRFVTFHNAWNYFSRRYGLTVAGVIEEAPGREPGPRHIARLVGEIKKTGAGVVFAEPQFSPRIAEAIAREAGAEVLILDPEGGTPQSPTYIEMMRRNVSTMERAMR